MLFKEFLSLFITVNVHVWKTSSKIWWNSVSCAEFVLCSLLSPEQRMPGMLVAHLYMSVFIHDLCLWSCSSWQRTGGLSSGHTKSPKIPHRSWESMEFLEGRNIWWSFSKWKCPDLWNTVTPLEVPSPCGTNSGTACAYFHDGNCIFLELLSAK